MELFRKGTFIECSQKSEDQKCLPSSGINLHYISFSSSSSSSYCLISSGAWICQSSNLPFHIMINMSAILWQPVKIILHWFFWQKRQTLTKPSGVTRRINRFLQCLICYVLPHHHGDCQYVKLMLTKSALLLRLSAINELHHFFQWIKVAFLEHFILLWIISHSCQPRQKHNNR